MTRVTWTRQAIEDVEAVKAYVARDSVRYAALLVERIVEAVGRLQSFPESGRVVPEVGDESNRCRWSRFTTRPGFFAYSEPAQTPGQRPNNAVNPPVLASRCLQGKRRASRRTGYRER